MNISRANAIYLAIGLLIAVLAYTLGKHIAPPPDANVNPFTKIGALGTQNGFVAEVFEFRKCYIVVQSVPAETGRAAVQMVCP